MLESMRRDGTLQEFNARYKAGRAAANRRGQGLHGIRHRHGPIQKGADPAVDEPAARAPTDAIDLRGRVSVVSQFEIIGP